MCNLNVLILLICASRRVLQHNLLRREVYISLAALPPWVICERVLLAFILRHSNILFLSTVITFVTFVLLLERETLLGTTDDVKAFSDQEAPGH